MNDKNEFKKISNPLTIIGLFAGIPEVAGTVVLPFVSDSLQKGFLCNGLSCSSCSAFL